MRAMPRRGDDQAVSSATSVEQQLAVHYAVARAFAEAETLDEVASVVLETLAEAFGWQSSSLWVLDEETGTLGCAAVYPSDGSLAEWAAETMRLRLPIGVGIPGRVWGSGQAAWVRDIESDDNFPRREIANRAGLRHAFAFPIRLRGGMVAVLELFAADVGEVDHEQMKFLDAVGHQLGSFIERIEARRSVALSEARKAGILGAAVDAIVSADQHGRILEFNAAAEAMFGRRRDEVIGRTIADTIVPDDLRAVHEAGLSRYISTGEARILGRRVRTSGKRADGSRLPVELTVTRIDVEGQPMFTAFIRDITREREAETARERFLEILSHELRTPVTAIYGGAKLLGRQRRPAQRQELIDDIGTEADRLYRLVEDLIVLARAERGALAVSSASSSASSTTSGAATQGSNLRSRSAASPRPSQPTKPTSSSYCETCCRTQSSTAPVAGLSRSISSTGRASRSCGCWIAASALTRVKRFDCSKSTTARR